MNGCDKQGMTCATPAMQQPAVQLCPGWSAQSTSAILENSHTALVLCADQPGHSCTAGCCMAGGTHCSGMAVLCLLGGGGTLIKAVQPSGHNGMQAGLLHERISAHVALPTAYQIPSLPLASRLQQPHIQSSLKCSGTSTNTKGGMLHTCKSNKVTVPQHSVWWAVEQQAIRTDLAITGQTA